MTNELNPKQQNAPPTATITSLPLLAEWSEQMQAFASETGLSLRSHGQARAKRNFLISLAFTLTPIVAGVALNLREANDCFFLPTLIGLGVAGMFQALSLFPEMTIWQLGTAALAEHHAGARLRTLREIGATLASRVRSFNARLSAHQAYTAASGVAASAEAVAKLQKERLDLHAVSNELDWCVGRVMHNRVCSEALANLCKTLTSADQKPEYGQTAGLSDLVFTTEQGRIADDATDEADLDEDIRLLGSAVAALKTCA